MELGVLGMHLVPSSASHTKKSLSLSRSLPHTIHSLQPVPVSVTKTTISLDYVQKQTEVNHMPDSDITDRCIA